MGRAGRTLVTAGAVAVVLFMLVSGGAAAMGGNGHGNDPSGGYTLASVPGINSIAVSPTQMFATTSLNCSQVLSINPAGHVKVIGVLPISASQCGEGSVALAPMHWAKAQWGGTGLRGDSVFFTGGHDDGAGGHCHCANRHGSLFDVQDGQLYEISAHGNKITLFATLTTTASPAVDFGLTWDSVGSFGYDLIVTSSSGRVWTVDPMGDVTLIANVATHIEGPAVAPMSFGDYGGDVLVAAQPSGTVLAINSTGAVSSVTAWPSAESIAFPSPCQCSFVGHKAVFFVANVTAGTIEAFPASFFPTLRGIGVVGGESNTGIAAFTAGGSATTLASHTGHLEQLAFVSCFPHYDQGQGGLHGHW